jgi:hypothetical protein
MQKSIAGLRLSSIFSGCSQNGNGISFCKIAGVIICVLAWLLYDCKIKIKNRKLYKPNLLFINENRVVFIFLLSLFDSTGGVLVVDKNKDRQIENKLEFVIQMEYFLLRVYLGFELVPFVFF